MARFSLEGPTSAHLESVLPPNLIGGDDFSQQKSEDAFNLFKGFAYEPKAGTALALRGGQGTGKSTGGTAVGFTSLRSVVSSVNLRVCEDGVLLS